MLECASSRTKIQKVSRRSFLKKCSCKAVEQDFGPGKEKEGKALECLSCFDYLNLL